MEFYNERLILVASYTRRGRLPGHGLCFWFAGEEWKRLFEAGKEKQHAGNRLPLNVFSCGRQRKKERFRERSVRRNLKKQALPWRAWQDGKEGGLLRAEALIVAAARASHPLPCGFHNGPGILAPSFPAEDFLGFLRIGNQAGRVAFAARAVADGNFFAGDFFSRFQDFPDGKSQAGSEVEAFCGPRLSSGSPPLSSGRPPGR